jgi:glycerol-3-phosphate dehydrogenase
LSLGLDDVSLVHRGVVPATARAGHPPALLDRAEIRDHARDGIEGAVSVVGVKYTTARLVAQRVIDLVGRKLGRSIAPSRTAHLPLLAAAPDAGTDLPTPSGPSSVSRAGGQARFAALSEPATSDMDAPGEVSQGGAPLRERVLEAVRLEMALTLEDVVVRRTAVGAAGYPGDAIVQECAAVMQAELGWGRERMDDELAAVGRFYAIGTGQEAARRVSSLHT